METLSKLLEQIASKTKSKIKEHVLFLIDKSTLEEHLSQPLLTNIKQFKLGVTFLTCYNGLFNATDKNKKLYFTNSIQIDDSSVISITTGFFETESLDKEIRRIIIEENNSTNETYPFTI